MYIEFEYFEQQILYL